MYRVLILALALPVPLAFAAPDSAEVANAPVPQALPTKLIQDVGDAILAQQFDPPSRQEMIIGGIRAVSRAAGVPAPAGLGRRVSVLVSPEQFAALVEETWPRTPAKKDVTPEALTRAFLEGMLLAIPSETSLLTAKEAKVQEQFQGNLYVGIHVQAGFDETEKRPKIVGVLDGGPAQRAGVRAQDLIDEIDGKDTLGMGMPEVLDRIRGEEGTDVEIVFRQPRSKEPRRLTITRGRLFRPSIRGLRERASGGWDVRIEGSAPVACLQFEAIRGSTPHELRQFARQLESEGFRALVLDLRSVADANFHATVLLADELLDGGTIGRVRTADRVTTYQAQPDSLFRGWPLAVLIDRNTAGPAEWLAAALQDNHRAVLVGTPTRGDSAVKTFVPVAGSDWAIEMVTRTLERGDGRPIGQLPTIPPGGMGAWAMPRLAERTLHRGGVTPDHATAAADLRAWPGRMGVRPVPDNTSKNALDFARKDALRRLTETLKSSGDDGR